MFRFALVASIALPTIVAPQAAVRDSARVDFSGVLFANYQYGTESGSQAANKFDLERAYLTFRIPAGERAAVRITTDVYQQEDSVRDAYYRGWSVRAKYAYLQYDYLNTAAVRSSVRVGILPTVFIEHDERFWPRWMAASPTDFNGYFSSADAGIANTISVSAANAEIYSTITNGPGYTSREVDRFKDYATRVTIRPWKANVSSGLNAVAFTVWGYKGATASRFVEGGDGQVGSVGNALSADRWGIHVGSASRRLTTAAQLALKSDEIEAGENTVTSPRTVSTSSSTLLSVYGIVRPIPSANAGSHPLALVARVDRVNAKEDERSYDMLLTGLSWDFSAHLSMSLDYQQVVPRTGSTISETRTWFAHFVASF